MAFYITSDWHFSHNNICGVDGFEPETRGGFKNTDEMNETIIKNINGNTNPDDIIYFLGDIGFGRDNETIDFIKSIKPKVIFIRGNHDNHVLAKKLARIGCEVHDVGVRHKQDGKTYLLTHYPLSLGNARANIRNICGHIHGKEASGWNSINIGVDSPEIKPLGLAFGQPVPLQDAVDLVERKWEGLSKKIQT